MEKFTILIIMTIFFGLGGILTVSLLYSLTGGDIPLSYGIVVDAGSSHTSFFLYKWDGAKDESTGVANQLDTCSLDPLADLPPSDAGNDIIPCLQNMTRHLPTGELAHTQIFLGATAGFRLLNISEPYQSEAILISIRCTLTNSGLALKKAVILSGQEEGLYAWITSNFLYNILQPIAEKSTLGALDMGGASTQISFSNPNHQNGSVHLKLYGNDYFISSTSYLCFGSKEIHRRHLALLVNLTTPSQIIYDPCLPMGESLNLTGQDLFAHPCTKTKENEEWMFQNRNKEVFFIFNGTSNSSECKPLVNKLLDTNECKKNDNPYCFEVTQNVPTHEKFLAFATFYYTANYLNATKTTLQLYRKEKNNICGKTWDELQKVPRKGVTSDILPMMCFQAHYVEYILTDNGYGFNETTWTNINFIKKANGADVGWALGYMINATNSIPAEMAEPPTVNLTATAVLIVLCLGILILSGFFIKMKLSKSDSENSYLRV